ncbi:MAG: hypothetical protein LBG19_10605 [Prevotellaceae bacterium]|jgi:hypothetical protein|nr:hypothetical protein [Prevotellaceae bacterium]
MRLSDFLKENLPKFEWFTDSEKQLITLDGYDGADAILTNLRDSSYPVVLVEDMPDGYLSFEDGFLDNRVCSFWVIAPVKTASKADKRKVMLECIAKGKQIMKLIVANSNFDEECEGLDRKRTPYSPRGPIGNNCYGYEFMPTFRTNIDMLTDG